MSIVQDFIARLLAIEPPVFAIVEGAAAFASIDRTPNATPAAYVLVEAETSAPSMRINGPVLQASSADVAVIIVTDNVSDATGAAAAADIEELKRQTRQALIGFVPQSSQDGAPVQHVEAELLKARGGMVWQRELFATSSFLEG